MATLTATPTSYANVVAERDALRAEKAALEQAIPWEVLHKHSPDSAMKLMANFPCSYCGMAWGLGHATTCPYEEATTTEPTHPGGE